MRFFFVLILLMSSTAIAGETKGKVRSIWIHAYNDYVFFNLGSAQPGFSACAVTHRYVVSTATQQGKNILSTILAAKAAGQTIIVNGKNVCTTHGDAEDIFALVIE